MVEGVVTLVLTEQEQTVVVAALRLMRPLVSEESKDRLNHLVERVESAHVTQRRAVADSAQSAAKGVRRNDGDTSWESALLAVRESSRAVYESIYWALRADGPMTDDELRASLAARGSNLVKESVTKRRGDLKERFWVRDTGLRRPGITGRPMIVWEAVA